MSALRAIMVAASSSPTNFFVGDIGIMSSFAPIKKMRINAQSMYCNSPKTVKGVHISIENITPAKIPIPPNEGVGT